MKATCECGTVHEASAYRLDAIGPVCDGCNEAKRRARELPAWSVRQLKDAMIRDLNACTSEFERINVRAMCGAEIRHMAEAWAQARKLTPAEVAIASEFGFQA